MPRQVIVKGKRISPERYFGIRLSNSRRAYFAGVIDARSGFGVLRRKYRTPYVNVRVRGGLPKRMHRIFGGSFRRPYTLRLYGWRVIFFLKWIRPYLLVKGPEADRLIREFRPIRPGPFF